MPRKYESRYEPPPINLDPLFVGRAAVVIEMAPNQWFQVILEIRNGDPDDRAYLSFETDREEVYVAEFLEPLRYAGPAIRRADIHLRGRIISQEEAQRPAWATAQYEIETRREIES